MRSLHTFFLTTCSSAWPEREVMCDPATPPLLVLAAAFHRTASRLKDLSERGPLKFEILFHCFPFYCSFIYHVSAQIFHALNHVPSFSQQCNNKIVKYLLTKSCHSLQSFISRPVWHFNLQSQWTTTSSDSPPDGSA